MSACLVNISLVDLGLDPVAGIVSFAPTGGAVARSGNSLVAPGALTVQLASDGTGSVEILPGAYLVTVAADGGFTRYPIFSVTVPNAALAFLAQLIDLPLPPTLDAAEQAVLDAQSARDEANGSAAEAAASATAAEVAESGAAASLSAATAAAEASSTSATAAATSASQAATSAQAASASATQAAGSATTAASIAASVNASQAAAATSATNAATSAAAASASEAAAATSATGAAASAATASTQATAAQAARTAAEAAEAAAETAQIAAEAARGAVENARDDAVAAKAAAEAARDDAQDSADSAIGADTSAAAHAAAALASANAADVDRIAAQAAKTSAEAARDTAVSSAASASSSAAMADADRIAAEAARVGIETIRDQAAVSASQANTSAGNAAGSSAQALAIYGSAAAQNQAIINAQNAASRAEAAALSASTAQQQDLSGVTAQALHRSPNAVTAMFLYDTSRDSDGGAWTEKCQHTSWWNEAINGKWLGAQDSELNARYANPTSGPELISNGNFASGTSGWTTTSANVSVAGGVATIAPLANLTRQGLSQAFTTVVGATYRLTYRVASGGGGNTHVYVGTSYASNANGSGSTAVGSRTLIFTATATTTVLTVGVWGIHETLGIADVSIRLVTALTAASGDYFQLTTDGRFYRLWKNVIPQSDNFSAWAKSVAGISVTSDQTVGSTVADVITEANGAGAAFVGATEFTGHFLWSGNAVTQMVAGLTYTFTVIARQKERTQIAVGCQWTFGAANGSVHIIDLASKTRVGGFTRGGNVGLGTPTIQDEPDGFVRITFTAVSNNAGAVALVGIANGGAVNYSGDGVSGIYVKSVQVEFGATSTAFEAKGADGSTTEVFRGNKRDFPRLAGIVAEMANVTIYDLTEAGRPMWMRFVGGGSGSNFNFLPGTATPTSVFAVNGRLGLAYGSNGLPLIDFPSDGARQIYSAGEFWFTGSGISARNSLPVRYVGLSYSSGLNNTVNAVAMTVLSDAPVDPATGLRVPTIAVATAGGVSVIQDEGNVRNSSNTSSFDTIALTPSLLSAGRADGTWYSAANPGALGASFALAQRTNTQAPGFGIGNTGKLVDMGRARLLRRSTTAARAQMARAHESDQARSLIANVGDTFNTGWMTGDIRRCFISDTEVGSVANPATVADRSYRAASATVNGTITRAQLASGTSLVGYSGFSAANYLREPFSADLDFGTGEWTGSAWVNVPATLPVASFPQVGAELVANGGFDTDTDWTKQTGWTISGGVASYDGTDAPNVIYQSAAALVSPKAYRVDVTVTLTQGSLLVRPQFNASAGQYQITASGSYSFVLQGQAAAGFGFVAASFSGRFIGSIDNVSVREVGPAILFDRAAASGPRLRLGMDGAGRLVAEASDGTTIRTVTTSAAYNTAQWLKARVNYTTDGTLAILVNGREVAATRGAPLLTLNNSSAVLTIGNSFALDAPFPGSIALLKLGATVPTPEQAAFMYEQEKQLFRAGALCVLPDSGALVDMTYDDATDRWVALSAANESYWTGLVRNSVQAVPAGSFSRVVAGSGLELAARTGTNPGVDVTIPAYGLREELVKRAESAARLSREVATYDFVGGFTANTTNGSTAITNVANLTYPTSYIGARISGTGIPANTTIVGVSGTTIYLSAAATATATGVSISFLDFILPVGLEARTVFSGGAQQREGATAAWVRLFDGFKEAVRLNAAPGATAQIQIQATRGAVQ